jgi:hypothetical protein
MGHVSMQTPPKTLFKSSKLAALLKRRQEHGTSAVEFALIAPVMVLMLFGATEISLLVSIDRKTTLAASTLGDLASQSELVSCAELTQIAAVTRQVFEPYDANNTTLVVAGLVKDGTVGKVEWSKTLTLSGGVASCDPVPGTAPLAVGKSVVIDTDLFATDGGLVVGDVEKVHTSVGTSFIDNNIRMKERFYLRPRRSLKLKWCTDTNPSVTAETCTSTT